MNEEILYNELYERTKEFGRTQFVRLLLDKEREIKELKEKLESSEKAIKELLRENKELSHIVANKVISDYDIDTPLKKELNDAKHLKEHELSLGLLNENEKLIYQNKKYKEVIDKVNKFCSSDEWGEYYKISSCRTHILDILKEVK